MREVDLADIKGVSLHTGKISIDQRGSFIKFFEKDTYQSNGFDPNFNSLAISTNIEKGTVRGLHFQSPPFEEEKMITCLQGRIFEIIVDLRRNSKTIGKWAAIEVSDENSVTLCLPKGIAHGYQTLTPGVRILYGLSSEFNQDHSYSLNYADINLGIKWPIPVKQISAKDLDGVSLQDAIELAAGHSIL